MKQKLNRMGGRVLLVLVIGGLLAIFASPEVLAAPANPVRYLPARVAPGQTFNVTVTFTSPFANFNGVATTDLAPSGWNVSVDKTWCAPPAYDCYAPIPEKAEYIWDGVYAADVEFTELYTVQVPSDAALGIYNFTDGTLGYYNGTDPNPIFEPIAGDDQVEVAQAVIAGQTRAANCTSLAGVNVTLYQDAFVITSTLSDSSGNYTFAVPAFGSYNVTASGAGFRDMTQPISVSALTTYTVDFTGDYGLIPNAPDVFYVAYCIHLWKVGTPPCQLTVFGVAAVIHAWKNPII